MAHRADEALEVEVEVKSRDCNQRRLWAQRSVAEGAGEVGVCRPH